MTLGSGQVKYLRTDGWRELLLLWFGLPTLTAYYETLIALLYITSIMYDYKRSDLNLI